MQKYFLLLLFIFSPGVVFAKWPIFLNSKPAKGDEVGEKVIYYFKEAVQASNIFYLADKPEGFIVRIVTKDVETTGIRKRNISALSVVWALYNRGQFDYLLNSAVYTCEFLSAQECGENLLKDSNGYLDKLQNSISLDSKI